MIRSKILNYLEIVTSILPTPIYWEDRNSIILGANELVLKSIGADRRSYVGKSIYEIYPFEIADPIKQHNDKVMEMDEILYQEEMIKTLDTGETKYYIAVKAPLRNDNGDIIGIVGTSVDITAEKNAEHLKKKTKMLEYLDVVAANLPTPIAWLDVNSVVLGVNEQGLKAVGTTRNAYVGKSLYEIYPHKMAEHIKRHDEEVVRKGIVMSQEESIVDATTGQIKYFNAIKAPLRDNDGKIIGLVVTGIDITAEKEAERLKLENEVHKNLVKEQEKFVTIANQVAHDIRSPLASLLMIVKSCTEIPEEDRIALREAAIGIGDIANHLLNQYQKKESDLNSRTEGRQPILLSATLLQLLTDKKYQHQKLLIKFDYDFTQKSHFAFIKIEPTAFKRMISNLINNAVDAFDNKAGEVILKLDVDREWVNISIQDNGKGMPLEIVDKIMNHIAVTAGKKTGHGIGLAQVRDTLQRNQGELSIDSTPGKGTRMTLTFPRIKAPYWIAEEIILGTQDIVVILDDDTSIHGAWDAHFAAVLKEAPSIQLEHFTAGKDALQFINDLPPHEKNRIFLLTDYELLKQELNGLRIVAKSKIQRSILVTSHYANELVRDQAAKIGTKILPKQLASEISIKLDPTIQYESPEKNMKTVDLIIVDDDEQFVKTLILFAFGDKMVDKYHDPYHFLENVSQYSKDTPIYLDNNFATVDLTGMEIAKQLHDKGYSRLYILSGEVFKEQDIPSYVTFIRKDDIDSIQNSIQH